MKFLILAATMTFSLLANAFDKYDNTVCEASSSDSERMTCFRDLKFNASCRSEPKAELECYRQAASKILSEQDQQEKAKLQAEATTKQKSDEKAYFYRSKMSPNALAPYTEKAYPKTFAKLGPRMVDVEVLKKRAAEMAIDSGKCDFVEIVDLSFDKSTIDHLLFWVDCANKQRIYLDEDQINSSAKVLTQAEKAWKEADALSSCQAAIKNNALMPSTVDIHSILGTTVHKSDITHNILVRIDFDAKNGFGVEVPYTAECVFAPGEQGEMSIRQR